jgi:hypothetical protein
MAQIIISALPPLPNETGTAIPLGTDITPATNILDFTEASTGTTYKYARWAELNFYLNAQGLTTYSAVTAGTTGALSATYVNGLFGVGATLTNAGAQVVFALDGVTLVAASRVLIKNQSAPAQNGIYTVTNVGSANTNWILTRALDYDTAAEVIQYGVVLINQGTTLAGQLWEETASGPFTIGTTSIVFGRYNAPSNSFSWSTISGTTQSASANNGYVVGNAAQTTITLPATASLGSSVSIRGYGIGGWILAANTGQTIVFGNTSSSLGGSLTSTNRYDTVDLTCIIDNSIWTVHSVQSSGLTIL